jgi:drug/metabolite transporter (DMT)-like permease
MFFFSSWIILSILGGIASNAFNFFSRYVLKDKDDPIVYAWFYETLRFIIFAAIAFFDWKMIITTKSLILFFLLGVTEALSVYWYMKMHSYSHLSVSTIISRTRLIWVPILAFLLFGEALKPFEYIGILILFLGLSIVISPAKLFIDKGAVYANLAAFMIALNLVIVKESLHYGSASVVNAAMALVAVIVFPIMFGSVRNNMNLLKHDNMQIKSLAVILNVVSAYFVTWALALGEASKVIALYQSMMVFSVVAGIIFLKERGNIKKKVLGTAVTIIGVLLLTSV